MDVPKDDDVNSQFTFTYDDIKGTVHVVDHLTGEEYSPTPIRRAQPIAVGMRSPRPPATCSVIPSPSAPCWSSEPPQPRKPPRSI